MQSGGDQTHTLIVVNHTDACVHVRVFRDEAGAPTTPATKPHDLAPKARFSVSVAEAPANVWVEADVMSDTDCGNTTVAAYMAGYAPGGGVIIAGKKSRYVFIAMPIKDVPPD